MRHFDPDQRDDGRDLLSDAEAAGYQLVETNEELAAVNETPVLGLFSDSHLDLYLDREHHPSSQPGLVEMTEKALELLENPDGFFMMMEPGRIDHCAHYNDPSILHEQIEGDEATGACLEFAHNADTGPTTVITTSDHECGGFSLGRDGIHNVNFELIDQLEASLVEGIEPEIRDVMPSAENYQEIVEEVGGLDWEDMDLNLNDRDKFWIIYLDAVFARNGGFREFLNEQMMFGFTSFGHTGVDVPLWADGPNAEFFNTARDNTDIPNALATTLGIDEDHD
jgi:alkaline phosphatase